MTQDVDKPKCPNPIGRVLRHGKFYPISCKSWKCSHCARVKKIQIMKRFENGSQGRRYRMLTLTELKHSDNHQNSLDLTKHWARLRASLRKHKFYLKDFIWTKEYKPLESEWMRVQAQKYNAQPFAEALKYVQENKKKEWDSFERSGVSCNMKIYPHLHVSIPVVIPQKLVSRLWFLATNQTADRVHIPFDKDLPDNCIAYMAKYFTKSDMMHGFKKGERRYGCSRNFTRKNIEQNYTYEINGEIKKIEYKDFKDHNNIFIPKGDATKDETLIRNSLRIGDNYGRLKKAYKQLIEDFNFYFGRRYNLNEDQSVIYDDIKNDLEYLGDYLNINGFSSYDKVVP